MRSSRLIAATQAGLLVVGSLVLVLGALELGVRWIDVPPDGFLRTRAALRWYERHWGPPNRFGYRDADHDYERILRTRHLIVLGDSFAAGSGVEDRGDRFANQLGIALGDEWTVFVVAIPGWSTADELVALKQFPYDPQVVVLSVYLNDIEGAARQLGEVFQPDVYIRPAFLQTLVQHSDLAELLYWRIATSRFWGDAGAYARWVYERFADDAVWSQQTGQLSDLLAVATARGAVPVVVLFPHLFDLEGSEPALARLREFFATRHVTVLDVRTLIAAGDWSPDTLFASPSDPHPSPALHRAVSEALLPLIPR